MNEKQKTISVIIVNYNTSDLLPEALESVVQAADGLDLEVLVVDNASTDGGFSRLPESLKRDPRFMFIQNEKNIGLDAMNIVLKRNPKYIATLDPDARFHPLSFKRLFEFMEKNPQAGAATANLLNIDQSLQRYIRRLMTPTYFFFMTPVGRLIDKYLLRLHFFNRYHYEDADLSRTLEIEQPSVSCLMVRNGTFGPYLIDPETPFYFTDVGLCKRIYERGYKIFLVSDAPTTHFKSVSFNKAKEKWRRREYTRSLAVYFGKHYPLIYPLLWLLLQMDYWLRILLFHTVGREPFR